MTLWNHKAPWKNSLVPSLEGSQQPYQVSKEGHFLAGAGNSGYLGGFEKREIRLGIAGESDSKSLSWLSSLKRHLKV